MLPFNDDLIVKDIEVNDWKEAIIKTCEILINKEYISKDYPNKLIKLTEEIGAYYVITKDIAIPHLRPEEGVLKSGYSLFSLKNGVDFNGVNIKYLIYILSLDNNEHIEKIKEIAKIIENKDFINI